MKKNFFQIITGVIAVALGISSCKKDKENQSNCVDCLVILDNDANASTICVGDEDAETKAKFDILVAYYRDQNIKFAQRCDK